MTHLTDPNGNDPTTPRAAGATATVAVGGGNGESGASAAAQPARDPLAALHKMSTTAGVSSTEYVAINLPSVVATLLGLASVLALIETVMLVVPLAAVGFGIAGLSQVRKSNGTQTGRAFAVAGILLALGMGGYVFAREAVARGQTRGDEQAIAAKIEELGRAIGAKDYPAAYALFSDRFKARVPAELFAARWAMAVDAPVVGGVESMRWNELVNFQDEPETGARLAAATALVKLRNLPEPARQQFTFRKAGGVWAIEDDPKLFPPPDSKRGGRR